jgi:hypothetical protein
MKKLSFKALDLGATEVLSREQLKNVLGGGNCGVLIDGQWREINQPSDGSGTIGIAISYVQNGYASRWCCDSCSHW